MTPLRRKIRRHNGLKNILVIFLSLLCLVIPFGFALYFGIVIRIHCSINSTIHIRLLKSLIRLKKSRLILLSYLRP